MPPTPDDAGSPPAQRAIRSVLAVGVVLSFSHIYVVQPILPLIGADLGVGADRASLAVTSTLVASRSPTWPGGRWRTAGDANRSWCSARWHWPCRPRSSRP